MLRKVLKAETTETAKNLRTSLRVVETEKGEGEDEVIRLEID